jgi:hypothetical protein
MKTAPPLGIFASPSSVERARNFPAKENSAMRRTDGLSNQRQIESRSRNCWDRWVSGHCSLGQRMVWRSVLQAELAVPGFVARLAAGRTVAAPVVAEVPLVAERNRMD